MKRYVLYFRDGPSRRGSLDLEEQRTLASEFTSFNSGVVVREFVEQESGDTRRDRARPALREAVAFTLAEGATLLIASIGRLSRNVHFTRVLLESKVPFVCCDMPKANQNTVHVLAALASDTSRGIADRQRQSLARLRAEGVPLGSARPGHWEGREHLRGTRKAIAQSAKLRKQRAAEAYKFLMPEIKARRERGETLPEIVDWLNKTGHTTTAGKPFTQTAVWRLIDRYLGKEWLGNTRKKTEGSRVGIAKVSG